MDVGCEKCRDPKNGILCHQCTEKLFGPQKERVTYKRKMLAAYKSVRRRLERNINAIAHVDAKRPLRLSCAEGHTWAAVLDPESEWGNTQPFCTTCGKLSIRKVVVGERTEHRCDESCKRAKKEECHCSCGGVNHGIEVIYGGAPGN